MSNLERNVSLVLVLETMFTFTMGASLLIYGAMRDYLIYGTYEIYQSLEAQGIVGNWIEDVFTMSNTFLDKIPGIIDTLFFISFVTLVISLLYSSYVSSRAGWFNILGFLTVGIVILLSLTSVFTQISEWFQAGFTDAILPSVSYTTPFFTFYVQHHLLINIILIVACVVMNFVDMDLSGFIGRKEREGFIPSNEEEFNDEVL